MCVCAGARVFESKGEERRRFSFQENRNLGVESSSQVRTSILRARSFCGIEIQLEVFGFQIHFILVFGMSKD